MRYPQPFIYLSTKRFCPHVRWFSLVFSTGLVVSGLLMIVLPTHRMVSGAQTHACVSETPTPLTTTPVPPLPQAGTILINEVLTNPASNWNCSVAASDTSAVNNSWIELYNPQTTSLDLYSTHTQISIDGGTNWYLLPFGTSIAAYGYLVLFPEKVLPPRAFWNVVLAMGNTNIDSLPSVPALGSDQSYARVPDGSPTWQYVAQPTIGASNDASGQTATPTPTKTPKTTVTPVLTATSTLIATPTLTTTPAPTGTPMLTATLPPTATVRGTGANGGASPGGSDNFGTQPAWNGMQLPPDTTPTPTDSGFSSTSLLSQPQDTPPTTQSSGGPNALAVGLIAVFVSLLLGTFLYYWRFLRIPHARTDELDAEE